MNSDLLISPSYYKLGVLLFLCVPVIEQRDHTFCVKACFSDAVNGTCMHALVCVI